MRLGVNVPNFGPGTDPTSLLGWVRFAEDAGFELAVMSDHVAPTPEVSARYPPPFYETFTTLAWVAGQTSHVRLGTSVVVLPYRHPLQVARVAACLDQLSGGRFVLGVGVGWARTEFEALDVSHPDRGRITDEALQVITDHWSADLVSRTGPGTSHQDVSTGPRPIQQPRPPIWVGGSSPPGIRRAARFGDAWHPIDPDLDWLETTGVPALAAAADQVDGDVPALAPRIRTRLTDEPVDGDRPAGVGSLDQVIDDLARFAALGAEVLVLDPTPNRPEERGPDEEAWRELERIAGAMEHRS